MDPIKKDLFSRLRRLFSTDVIIRNNGENQLKVFDINQIQQSGQVATNTVIDRFNKVFTSGNGTSIYGNQLHQNHQNIRTQLYSDYDSMDTDAIVASALDIIADESTLKNDMGEVLQIKSTDEDIQKILYNLFYDVLNIEFNLWPWIRNMCKYGDFFLKLEIAEKFGVYNVIPYTAFNIERLEGRDRENPTKIQFRYSPEGPNTSYNYKPSKDNGSTDNLFDNYEIAHFRLLADVNYLPYGRSYIEPARKLFKQYTLMEDAMLIHRIVRAPEKRIFYLNVGSIPPNEVDAFMEKTVSTMKRTPHINPETGDYNLRFNLQNLLEDYYIPVRGNDSSTKIDTAQGMQWDGIVDVEYFRDKLFAALKVPKAFMGYDENTDGKATLAAQDIRFARTIERIQRITISELYKIAIIHLYTQGYRDENLGNFEISLTTPSIIYDQERIELLKSKVELAASMIEQNLFPTDFIYEHIFHLSEDQYDEYRDLIMQDSHRKFRLAQIESEGNDPLETGKSYGTPHDLASLYGPGRMVPGSVPPGYDENKSETLGRPKNSETKRNTQADNFGNDRLGSKGMKNDYNNEKSPLKYKPKGGSPLALESQTSHYLSYKDTLELIPQEKTRLLVESPEDTSPLLDESNIK